jgi:hypothetical protein
LVSSLRVETVTAAGTGRKQPRNALPIAGAVVGAVLIITVAGMFIGDFSAPHGDAPDGVGRARDSGADVREGTGLSAEDAETETETDTGEAEIALLYLYILGDGFIKGADAKTEPEISPSRKSSLAGRIDAYMSEEAGKAPASLPTDSEINSDLDFTNLTEPANALIDRINAGREDKGLLSEVVGLREKAYSIYPLRVLKKLLATDYGELGAYYAPAHKEEALDAFICSIKYRMAYLGELRGGSAARSAEIRRVGGTFAEIAEIGGLDAGSKWHAELIASCLSDMAAR